MVYHQPHSQASLVFFFVFFFLVCIQYNTQAEEWRKMGRPGNTYHVTQTWVDVGGWGGGGGCFPTTYLCAINLRASFLPFKVKYSRSRKRLGSCVAMECSKMKTSMLFECVEPSPLRPPDTVHMIGVPRPSPFSPLFRFRVLY